MINFAKPMPASRPDHKRQIKQVQAWVEDALPPHMEDVMVMVVEMQCFEPDCAPLETVITLLANAKSIVFKIFKPVAEVTPADAHTGLQVVLSGATVPEHMKMSVVQQQ